MRRAWAAIDRTVARVDAVLVGACLLVAIALNVALVVGRFAFNYSANWMEEMSVYAIIWMVFLGALVSDRQGSQINIDLLYHFVSAPAKRLLQRLASFLQGVTCLVLAGLTLKTVVFTFRIGEVSLSTLQAPVWVLMAVMPPCFLVLGLRGIARSAGVAAFANRDTGEAHL